VLDLVDLHPQRVVVPAAEQLVARRRERVALLVPVPVAPVPVIVALGLDRIAQRGALGLDRPARE
jgi:hypothetical protein